MLACLRVSASSCLPALFRLSSVHQIIPAYVHVHFILLCWLNWLTKTESDCWLRDFYLWHNCGTTTYMHSAHAYRHIHLNAHTHTQAIVWRTSSNLRTASLYHHVTVSLLAHLYHHVTVSLPAQTFCDTHMCVWGTHLYASCARICFDEQSHAPFNNLSHFYFSPKGGWHYSAPSCVYMSAYTGPGSFIWLFFAEPFGIVVLEAWAAGKPVVVRLSVLVCVCVWRGRERCWCVLSVGAWMCDVGVCYLIFTHPRCLDVWCWCVLSDIHTSKVLGCVNYMRHVWTIVFCCVYM